MDASVRLPRHNKSYDYHMQGPDVAMVGADGR